MHGDRRVWNTYQESGDTARRKAQPFLSAQRCARQVTFLTLYSVFGIEQEFPSNLYVFTIQCQTSAILGRLAALTSPTSMLQD